MPPHLIILALAGLLISIGAILARAHGHLKGRSAGVLIAMVVAVLATALWLTPIMPIIDRHIDADGLPASGR